MTPQPSDPYNPQPPQPGVQLPPVPQAAPPGTPPATPSQPDPRTVRLEQELAEQRRLTNNLATVLNQRQPGPSQPLSREELNRQFYQDPIGHSQAIAVQAAREVAQQYGETHMDTLIAAARDRVRTQDPELFDRYATEIQARVELAGPQFRTNINVWQSAFNMVKGEHFNEIRDQIRQQQPGAQAPAIHISREPGPAAPSTPPGPAPRVAELSAEEKSMAKKLGISEDMYRAGKEYNDKQTDLEFSPLGPSSWDKVITFDSRTKRREERDRNRRQPAA